QLEKAGIVQITAQAIGRVDFRRIELVQNGRVIRTQSSKPGSGHFTATFEFDLDINEPCWLALRIPPPPVRDDPELHEPVPFNEYGAPLFAHTSAIEIQVAGRSHFDRSAAIRLLGEMRDGLSLINEKAVFSDDNERARVVDVYHDAITIFERRLANVQ